LDINKEELKKGDSAVACYDRLLFLGAIRRIPPRTFGKPLETLAKKFTEKK